ncbi:MAG: hypothetical protein AB7I18_12155 [Candidatus Berkiella sp.]
MTPQQVQFCHAIAHGYARRARMLAPQINITQTNDSSNSPAMTLLWAMSHSPQALIKKLEELYPETPNRFQKEVTATPKEMEALIRAIVFPLLKRNLNMLLKPIGLKVVSLDRISDAKQNHFIDSSFACVDLIINDEFFDDINASQRRFAENLFTKLLPIVEKMKAAHAEHKVRTEKPAKEQPYTIQLLMAILNGKPSELPNMPTLNLQVNLEPLSRTFLPSAGLSQPPSLRCQPKPIREEEELKHRHRLAPLVH